MVDLQNAYVRCREVLLDRLEEAAPRRIQLLTGPRQVGKTTLLLEIAAQFGDRAVYAAGDEPDAALPGFWERCWVDAERRAQHGPAVLLLDEVHHLSNWAARLKGQWDRARARCHRVQRRRGGGHLPPAVTEKPSAGAIPDCCSPPFGYL